MCKSESSGSFLQNRLAIPAESTATLALRTMQIVTEETGILNTADPLAGSYYVGALTDKLEEEALGLFEMVEPIISAAKKYATIGEICDVLRKVHGTYNKSAY